MFSKFISIIVLINCVWSAEVNLVHLNENFLGNPWEMPTQRYNIKRLVEYDPNVDSFIRNYLGFAERSLKNYHQYPQSQISDQLPPIDTREVVRDNIVQSMNNFPTNVINKTPKSVFNKEIKRKERATTLEPKNRFAEGSNFASNQEEFRGQLLDPELPFKNPETQQSIKGDSPQNLKPPEQNKNELLAGQISDSLKNYQSQIAQLSSELKKMENEQKVNENQSANIQQIEDTQSAMLSLIKKNLLKEIVNEKRLDTDDKKIDQLKQEINLMEGDLTKLETTERPKKFNGQDVEEVLHELQRKRNQIEQIENMMKKLQSNENSFGVKDFSPNEIDVQTNNLKKLINQFQFERFRTTTIKPFINEFPSETSFDLKKLLQFLANNRTISRDPFARSVENPIETQPRNPSFRMKSRLNDETEMQLLKVLLRSLSKSPNHKNTQPSNSRKLSRELDLLFDQLADEPEQTTSPPDIDQIRLDRFHALIKALNKEPTTNSDEELLKEIKKLSEQINSNDKVQTQKLFTNSELSNLALRELLNRVLTNGPKQSPATFPESFPSDIKQIQQQNSHLKELMREISRLQTNASVQSRDLNFDTNGENIFPNFPTNSFSNHHYNHQSPSDQYEIKRLQLQIDNLKNYISKNNPQGSDSKYHAPYLQIKRLENEISQLHDVINNLNSKKYDFNPTYSIPNPEIIAENIPGDAQPPLLPPPEIPNPNLLYNNNGNLPPDDENPNHRDINEPEYRSSGKNADDEYNPGEDYEDHKGYYNPKDYSSNHYKKQTLADKLLRHIVKKKVHKLGVIGTAVFDGLFDGSDEYGDGSYRTIGDYYGDNGGLLGILGGGTNSGYTNNNYGGYDGSNALYSSPLGSIISSFRNLGFFGIIPAIVLKLFSKLLAIIRVLQKNKFIKTFLVPTGVLLLVNGLILFLVWWLYPEDCPQISYGGNYQQAQDYGSNSNSYSQYSIPLPYANKPESQGYGKYN